MRREGAKKKLKKRIIYAAEGILLAALIFSGVMLADYAITGARDMKNVDSVRQVYYAAGNAAPAPSEEDAAALWDTAASQEQQDVFNALAAYNSLLGTNPEAVGWLNIPGTGIDYPVAQAKDNEYYLSHSFTRVHSGHGCIFMDYMNQQGDLNIVLYGHNMRDGTFFGDLSKFTDKGYCAEHGEIELNLWGEQTYWKIFSVQRAGSDVIQVTFSSADEFAKFVQAAKRASVFDTGVVSDSGESILTLSTCGSGDSRFLVQAVRVE